LTLMDTKETLECVEGMLVQPLSPSH
jgi:hypothetical protein